MVNSDHVPLQIPRNHTNFNPVYLRNAMVDLLTRPPREETQMSTDVEVRTELEVPVAVKKFKPVETDIDHLKDRMARLTQARADRDTLAAFIAMEERFIKDELAKLGATDGRINGVVAVTYRPKNDYRWAEFRETYPEIHDKFLEPQVVDVLNKAKLLQEHGGLLAQFRSSTFSVK